MLCFIEEIRVMLLSENYDWSEFLEFYIDRNFITFLCQGFIFTIDLLSH